MAIKGSLAEAALPNVIQLLAISLKSGCLSVTDGKNFGNIFIKDGKIIYATILNREKRLGDILVSKEEIDEKTLHQALDIQRSQKKKRIGEVLVDLHAISRKTLEKELHEQIEQTIFTMLTWESGYFNFETGLLPSPEEYTVQLSPQEVLLEAARRIDEWHKIENKMPAFETILSQKGNAQNVPLTAQEKKIMDLIDGMRSIEEILRLSEFEFFETCRAIYGLLTAGLLKKPKMPVKKPTVELAEGKNLGVGFYRTEMFNDAEREFTKVLDIDSSEAEALLYLGLIELRRGNYQTSMTNFLKALEKESQLPVLINLGFVCNKLGLLDEAVTYLNHAKELAPEDPKVKCNLGITFYKQGNLDESLNIFQQVLEQCPELTTPYIYLAIIYLKKGNTQSGLSILDKAIQKFPGFGVFKNNQAVLYECMGKPEESEKLYRQALELEPRNVVLCRNLADFYYEKQILGAAKELYERVPGDERDWQTLFKLGSIYLRQGDSNQALNFWEKARALNPSEEMVIRNIEVLQRSSGKRFSENSI